MANQKLLLTLAVLGVLMCTSLVSAYVNYGYNYGYGTQGSGCVGCSGTSTFNTRSYQFDPSIRVGGFFGQSSQYIIGLRPGTYYQNCYQGVPAMGIKTCGSYSSYIPRYAGLGGYWGYDNYGYGYNNYRYSNYGKYSSYNYPYFGIM